MRIKSFEIILISFIAFILNMIVFFIMGEHAMMHEDFMSQFMYYLSVGIMLISGVISYIGYRDMSHLSVRKKIAAHSIFYIHMFGLAIFLGTMLYALT